VDDFGADAILLDSHAPGSGQVFDWSVAEGAPTNRRLILAGGLTPDNVATGIDEVHPWGVDVSTGVEVDGEPGRKDPLKVQAFIHAARAAAPSGTAHPERSDDGGPFDWAESGL
jgi:phosphoribosylanthranilate isomerase